jgi:hypothetical protein
VTYNKNTKGQVRLYDIAGKMKSSKQLYYSKAEFDLSDYATGFYTIEIITESKKILKKNY